MENHIKILAVLPRIQYVANGENRIFEFPFAIFKNENIRVYLGDVIQNSATYTVSGAGQTEGGNITFLNAPAQGTIVTIYRSLDIERSTDFQEGGALRANALNYEFDYQIACQQQIADTLNRSMVLPPYAANTNVNLTLPLPNPGKAIVWNSDGTNLENSTVEVNALESTLAGYKTAAETAASTATVKAQIATEKAQISSDKADIATAKAQIATDKATEAALVLADKADKDMDNLSATGKKAVVALGMPDYAAGISKAWNTSILADKDGWVQVFGSSSNNDNAAVNFYISTDGVNFTKIISFYTRTTGGLGRTVIPMPKGVYYKGQDAAGGHELIFYPCKGA